MKWTYRNDPFKIICLNYQKLKTNNPIKSSIACHQVESTLFIYYNNKSIDFSESSFQSPYNIDRQSRGLQRVAIYHRALCSTHRTTPRIERILQLALNFIPRELIERQTRETKDFRSKARTCWRKSVIRKFPRCGRAEKSEGGGGEESRLPRNELISSLVRLQAASVNISFHNLPRQ